MIELTEFATGLLSLVFMCGISFIWGMTAGLALDRYLDLREKRKEEKQLKLDEIKLRTLIFEEDKEKVN
jgi:hypothetical protein